MYQVSVCYHHPEDPDAFVAHYSGTHAGLARAMPGVKAFEWSVSETLDGSPPGHFLTARLTFPTKDDALASFGSPQGQAALADLSNFAAAGVTVTSGEIRD